jgi:hypothetical protein
MKIEDFGPKFYAQNLENYGSNVKVTLVTTTSGLKGA